jgi:hypothetical protein
MITEREWLERNFPSQFPQGGSPQGSEPDEGTPTPTEDVEGVDTAFARRLMAASENVSSGTFADALDPDEKTA